MSIEEAREKTARVKELLFGRLHETPRDISVPRSTRWTGLQPVPQDDYKVEYYDDAAHILGRVTKFDNRLIGLRTRGQDRRGSGSPCRARFSRFIKLTEPNTMPCVYTLPAGLCDGKAPLSKREHYLPRALGNFEGDERLADRICDSCQARCARIEEVFARNSAEAFFREMVGRVGRKSHGGKKNIFYEPTLGIPPLAVLGQAPGHDFEMLWELVTEDKCQPMSQLVFLEKGGRSWQLAFRRGVFTAERIRELLKERGMEANQIVAISNSDPEAEEMKALTDELAPDGKEGHLEPVKDGVQMEGEMKAAISRPYLRAIAKIGFHFFLQHFNQFSGLEPEFDEIKRFIYVGDPNPKIVEPLREPFVRELQLGGRLNRWGHLLSAECSEQGIEARMQFFAGPKVHPIVWRVLIGKNPARIIYHQSVGYGYLYFDDVGGDYHGERVELTPLERIVAPSRPMMRYFRR